MIDSLKTIGTTTGTSIVNIWQLVPEVLGVILIIMNITPPNQLINLVYLKICLSS